MGMINNILRLMGYMRVYDIENDSDLTIVYYLLKNLNKISQGPEIDITYPKLGVCRYVGDKYKRYICYDAKLLEIDHITIMFSAKKYYDIKKIDIICRNKKNIVQEIDVTNAKSNFYDNNYFSCIKPHDEMEAFTDNSADAFSSTDKNNMSYENKNVSMRSTEILDIIKFYQTINGSLGIIDKKLYNIMSIRVFREIFDDDLLEFVTTCEEIYLTKSIQGKN